MLVREEFSWSEVDSYLRDELTIAFVGPGIDERSRLFAHKWRSGSGLVVVQLSINRDLNEVSICRSRGDVIESQTSTSLTPGLASYIKTMSIASAKVCMDLSSLQHSVFMYLTHVFTQGIKPRQLFATYAEPEEYPAQGHLGQPQLSTERLGLRAIPGFTRRYRGTPIKMLAFLGFEGDRLSKIIEDMSQIKTLTPVIGFPSFQPGWHLRSLRNCARAIDSAGASSDIQKCNASSIFAAYEIVDKLKPRSNSDVTYALAPLGTRPHSMACAIFAAQNRDTLLIYDHPVEAEQRSKGIGRLRAYHLTSFIA